MLAIFLLCPSGRPGSWESVPEEQPVVEATEMIKGAGFQIDDARHRVYFASRGEFAGTYKQNEHIGHTKQISLLFLPFFACFRYLLPDERNVAYHDLD